MTERTLELALLLPRQAECGGCVSELSREMGRLEGVHGAEADVSRGLLAVHFDEQIQAPADIEIFARRAGAQAHCETHCPLATHRHGPIDLTRPLPGEAGGDERRVLHVTGMDCADCAVKLQSALRKERGVRGADVNFGAATLAVTVDPDETDIARVFRAVRRLGYDTIERREQAYRTKRTTDDGRRGGGGREEPVTAAGAGGGTAAARTAAPGRRERRAVWPAGLRARLTLASGALTAAGFASFALAPAAADWLFALAVVTGGLFVARAAFFSLRARQVDMNVLMVLAMIGAGAIGEWSEAALVAFLFSLGTVLQAATLERTRRAISGLMNLAPPAATVLRPTEQGPPSEHDVPIADIAPGDLVLVRPGERSAVDGVVTEGTAAADQAPVTGESLPVAKAPGDHVFAGSIIEGGALTVRVTAGAGASTIARIVHMVEEAQARRAPAQTIVDRFANRYTPVVVALAAIVAFVPPLLGASFDTWFYRGLALLIISCPCALVISTPVSILAALARATRSGVLIKGGVYLEQMAGIKAVAFDKTGTLTEGRPRVTDVTAFNDTTEAELLSIAAALERYSEHPLARAIVERSAASPSPGGPTSDDTRGGPADDGSRDGHEQEGSGDEAAPRPHVEVERFRAIAGMGVRAELGGRVHYVGRPGLLGAHGADPALLGVIAALERQGKTTVVVGDAAGAIGVIAVSDPLRAGAAEAIAELRRLGVSKVTMLTGDNAETAAAVAAQAGVDDVRAGLLPADKVAAIAELRDRAGAVAMVGDGVNDAPALAAASLGVAMGAAGTDAALETADIALMGDDLGAVPATVRLARRTTRVIWQNIVFSIAVKAVFLVLAPLGLVSLWLAVFADMGTSLLVTANGLRLHRR